MKGFGAVYRKEMYAYLASPVFYVVALAFLVLGGYFFYSSVAYYNAVSFQAVQAPYLSDQLSLTEMVIRPVFLDLSIVLLLLAPLLTMRTYAEERRSGTMELLFTYPLSDWGTLMAKFLAVMTIFLLILAAFLPDFLLLEWVTDPNWRVILSSCLGLFLLAGAFFALGMFTSSLTRNQIIAAVIAFTLLLFLWIISWLSSTVGPSAAALLNYLSVTRHYDNFAKGVIDSRDILYYLEFIALFLFVTLRQVESYRWRG